MDLGECPKIHDLALRADYQQASKPKDYFYDVEVRFSHLHIKTSESTRVIFTMKIKSIKKCNFYRQPSI